MRTYQDGKTALSLKMAKNQGPNTLHSNNPSSSRRRTPQNAPLRSRGLRKAPSQKHSNRLHLRPAEVSRRNNYRRAALHGIPCCGRDCRPIAPPVRIVAMMRRFPAKKVAARQPCLIVAYKSTIVCFAHFLATPCCQSGSPTREAFLRDATEGRRGRIVVLGIAVAAGCRVAGAPAASPAMAPPALRTCQAYSSTTSQSLPRSSSSGA